MNKIHILDCTLRDGGYCNRWNFGYENIRRIISALQEAGIDIVECGFLTDKVRYNPDITKFTTVRELSGVIPDKRNGKLYVAMMNYGEYDVDALPEYDGLSIDGIRVAFHKHDLKEAFKICRKIRKKGYKLFIQAMVSLNYDDDEFLNLIKCANECGAYAFYIVDSFGMMKSKDLIRLFYMVEHNLNNKIWIGFHSHNNMQLAYSNAQALVNIQTNRNLIIDSSVYGMGRGAGNLNTELFVNYLNENTGTDYDISPLLEIIDEILEGFYKRSYWGYSLPNYLSATYNAHPNYAGYLDDKKTLTVYDMHEIFKMMSDDKKASYDREYIERLYMDYMEMGKVQNRHESDIQRSLESRKVLLIAPGKSSTEDKEKINSFIDNNDVVVISINFEYKYADTDFIFLSNLRRFRELEPDKRKKCIVTSNIPADKVYLRTQYRELVNSEEAVKDNAGLMAVRFLIKYGVKEVYLAGFDGYSHDSGENYGDSNMVYITKNDVLDAMNKGIANVLKEYKKSIKIIFVTEPGYIVA